jgi:hypothetical protein
MKYALIIGNNRYTDQKLAQLKTPAADSQALARVLKDQSIGSFDEVLPLVNKTEFQVSRAISTFLANKKPEDLVLVYFSGHGILDDRGRLFLALKDTQTHLLKSTAISASFIADEMDSCRSKRQILILDCCHSGAFERGVKGEEQRAVTETTFEGLGFGRVVLTASASTQYALEGDQVIKQTELSLFTHFLLEGLQTGKADINNDGYISLDEWYDYTYTQVLSTTPKQVPHKWSYHQQGDLIIAKNPFMKKKVVELSDDLLRLLESPYSSVREAAVKELGSLLRSRNAEYAELARSALEKLTEDDSRTVSLAAIKQLSDFQKPVEEREVVERITRQKAESEAAQKIEHEKAEQAARDKLQRETVEKAKRERGERGAAQIAVQKEAFSNTSKTAVPKVRFFMIGGGVIFIIFVLCWLGSKALPQILSFMTSTKASATAPRVATVVSSTPTVSFAKTAWPSTTPTITPSPIISPTPPCGKGKGEFVMDITIPDGTQIAPGAAFTKTWRLRNTGTCTWSGYTLVFASGDLMGATSPKPIGIVTPGQDVDLSVSFTAPTTPGYYRSDWAIRNSSGVLISLTSGTQADTFWVVIRVVSTPTSTP